MPAERTFKLILEYDGTDFCGYQTQTQGVRTVQTLLAEAVYKITQQHVNLAAAGRTDTGVHALGQVVSFPIITSLSQERLALALNSVLPGDISVARAEEAEHDFHARFSAKSRTYLYTVWTRRTRSALWGRYTHHLRRPALIEKMRSAAKYLLGEKDFASFAKSGGDPGPTTVRNLEMLKIRRVRNDFLIFELTANGFLRSMVRNIVGSLIEVGVGDLDPEDIAAILQSRDRAANPCAPAPAKGLCLTHVKY